MVVVLSIFVQDLTISKVTQKFQNNIAGLKVG